MKRYIRLKDGQIIDTEHKDADKYLIDRILGDSFAAESDNILDLIQVGDLVEYTDYIYDFEIKNLLRVVLTCDLVNDDILAMKPYCCDENELQKLYTKQGDNYILVWDKERGVI